MRHRFHSICPYFAMFPESFVEHWIGRLTAPGDVVLDPFSGRGTTAFQGLLMDRQTVACDINPVAYCITRAKTNAPKASSMRRRLTILQKEYNRADWLDQIAVLPDFFHVAYHADTLAEILFLRDSLRWKTSDTDCMIAALVLGSLHGETKKSQYYLSNQMPRTISTKPNYSIEYWRRHGLQPPVRDSFRLLRNRIDFRYVSEIPAGRALVVHSDMRGLAEHGNLPPIKCVITSPPYLDVTNFEEDQWLRLWFLGGEPHPTYRKVSKDDRHLNAARYWELIADMWKMLGAVLAPTAQVVVRLGGNGLSPNELADGLFRTSAATRRTVELQGDVQVSEIGRRQTDSFRPGSRGCLVEVDCHFAVGAPL